MFRLDEKYTPLTLEELPLLTTPEGTESFKPVPHHELVGGVLRELEMYGITCKDLRLFNYRDELFGIATIGEGEHFNQQLGIRNTHNKRFPLGLAVGAEVHVCSNLCFSGTQEIKLRHTKNVGIRLESAIPQMVASIPGLMMVQNKIFSGLRERAIGDQARRDFLLEAAADGLIPQNKLRVIIDQVNEPTYEEFRESTLWAFYNNMTTPLQGGDLQTLWSVSEGLLNRLKVMI